MSNTPVAYWYCRNAACSEVDVAKSSYSSRLTDPLCGNCGELCEEGPAPAKEMSR